MPEKQQIKIVYAPVDSVIPWEGNANVGNVPVIEESIQEFDFVDPLLIQASTGKIIAGNHRHQAAINQGYETLPVVYLDLDDKRALKLHLMHNRSSKNSTWDDRALLAQLMELDGDLAASGFDRDELNDLQLLLEESSGEPFGDDDEDKPEDEHFWPKISLQVRPSVFDAWQEALNSHSGKDDAEKLEKMLRARGFLG